MDFLIELLIQLVVQVVVELVGELLVETVFRGIGSVLLSAVGRAVTAALVGLGFGLVWGMHLTGGASWPKLLWVSLALAAAAAVRAMGSRPREAGSGLLQPQWRWPADRLLAFALLNASIAAGIGLGFRPSLS